MEMEENFNNIVVSIFCIAYNHEKYIKDALDGFVMQKTNFKYEIIVHDDASTDRTREIVDEYKRKYPDVIRTIYQRENQYSQGKTEFHIRNKDRLRGKYVAICEGDDYWTDCNKLQKQVDYLESHPECVMCFHATNTESVKNGKKIYTEAHPYENSGLVTVDAAIRPCGGVCKALSQVIRVSLFDNEIPDFIFNCVAGDYPFQIWYPLKGTVYYIDEVMGVYRFNSEGSWTNRLLHDSHKRIQHKVDTIEMLLKFNEYTEYRYKNSFYYAICNECIEAVYVLDDVRLQKDWTQIFKEYSNRIEDIQLKKIVVSQLINVLNQKNKNEDRL